MDFLLKHIYTQFLTWPFNFTRDFIERTITSRWLLKVPPCLSSRDWSSAYATHLVTDEVRCRYGIGRVVTNAALTVRLQRLYYFQQSYRFESKHS